MQAPQDPQPAQLPQPAQPAAPGTNWPGGPGTNAPYIYTRPQVSGPEAVLKAAQAQRNELTNQLERLEEKRSELAQQLRPGADAGNRQGIERRIAEVDQRISDVEKQIADADAAVAKAAAIPGAVVEHPEPPPDPYEDRDEMIAMVGSMFIFFVLFPITIAYARRLWRRGAAAVSELPKVIAERLTRLDQAVDAIAIEVERISEGQRFLTKVMTDNASRAIGAGPAQPVEVNAREAAAIPRSTSR
jgi:Effector-associated domain 9